MVSTTSTTLIGLIGSKIQKPSRLRSAWARVS